MNTARRKMNSSLEIKFPKWQTTLNNGGVNMSEHSGRKPNFEPTNPDRKLPNEQQRGKAKSNARGKTR